jgi:DNA invertase Pin-like site-specific DNA recombinase
MSPAKKPTLPVDVYIRVSRVGVRDQDSVSFQSPKQQEDRCRAQLKADGLKLGKVFTDLDESGAKASRPEFDKAMARIGTLDKEGKVVPGSQVSGGIIVYDLSRFGRSTRNVLDGIDFIEACGAVFISCDEKFDTSTGTGRFVLTMFAALRELERTRSAERWETSKAGARARGVHIGGPRAGYVRDAGGKLVEHPEHLTAVQAAFALRARGGSWAETAAILTDAGVPSSKSRGKGATWSRQATRNVIQNAAYDEANGGPIPSWQWRKAQPKAGEARVRGEGYLLGQGLVRCATCGGGMHKNSNGARYQVLRCETPGTGHATMSYETAEDYILSLAFSHLGTTVKPRPGEDEAKREALLLAVEGAQAEFDAAWELLGITPPPDSKPAVALSEAQSALAEFEEDSARPVGIYDLLTPVGARQEFEKLPIPERRRILREVVEKVVLSPGRGNPGARLDVWFTDGTHYGENQTDLPVWATEEHQEALARAINA